MGSDPWTRATGWNDLNSVYISYKRKDKITRKLQKETSLKQQHQNWRVLVAALVLHVKRKEFNEEGTKGENEIMEHSSPHARRSAEIRE